MDKININFFTPASMHSSNIYSIPGLPLIGSNSFAKTLVKGSSLVPNPANGLLLSCTDLSLNLSNLALDSAALLSFINKCIISPNGANSGFFNGS